MTLVNFYLDKSSIVNTTIRDYIEDFVYKISAHSATKFSDLKHIVGKR